MRDELSLISASTALGQTKPGTDLAPGWLIHHGLINKLEMNFKKVDIIPEILGKKLTTEDHNFEKRFPFKMPHFVSSIKYNKFLNDIVNQELEKNNFVLTAGGDHSIAIGTLSGALRANPKTKIIWIDAHTDINTPKTSPSGNIHGMPLSFLMKCFTHEVMNPYLDWIPKLDPKNLVIIGARDIDAGEIETITKLGVTVYTSKEVKAYSIETILNEALLKLDSNRMAPIHLSFDVDGLDPHYIPSTGTAVDQGLSLEDGRYIISTLMNTNRLTSMDLVEINPLLGTKVEVETTKESVFSLLEALKPSYNITQPPEINKIPLFY